MDSGRAAVLALVAVTVTMVVVCGALLLGDVRERPAGPAADPLGRAASTAPDPRDPQDLPDLAGADRRTAARAVLRTWDERRADAWQRADATDLGELYTEGSVAGVRDVARLRAWTASGARVVALQPHVLAFAVRRSSSRRLVVEVTDRVVVAARSREGPLRLPDDERSTRVVDLRLVGGAWRVASVRDVDG